MGQHASLACLINKPQEAFISNKNTAHTKLHRTLDVAECIHELIHSHVPPAEDFAIRGQCLCCALPRGARAYEEANFNTVPMAKLNHLANIGIAQQHNAAPLGNTMDGDATCLSRFDYRAKCRRAFNTWNLYTIVRSIRERCR